LKVVNHVAFWLSEKDEYLRCQDFDDFIPSSFARSTKYTYVNLFLNKTIFHDFIYYLSCLFSYNYQW
jgi:hypothetical protein